LGAPYEKDPDKLETTKIKCLASALSFVKKNYGGLVCRYPKRHRLLRSQIIANRAEKFLRILGG